MDHEYKNQLQYNTRSFQRSLDRIVEKYSKVQHEHDAEDVDLDSTQLCMLARYMTVSKKNVDKLESTSFVDLTVEPLQDITRNSSFESTGKERSSDFETTRLSEGAQNSGARHTGVLDESQRNFTLLSDQPEDHDEVLEMSLQSRGTSLGERYPDMVSQIGMSWRRQQISEAADSVRRRYQRWRKSTQSHSTNSSHIVQRQNSETSKRELFSKLHKSPLKSVTSTVTKAVSPSPVKIVTVSGQRAQHGRSPVRSEAPIVVMDMPAIFEESERIHNKTFTLSEPSLLYSTFNSRPPRSCHSPNKPFEDLDIRMKDSVMSLRRLQTLHPSVHDRNLIKEKYSSPVRTSPYKAKLTSRDNFNEQTDFYGSPTRTSSFKPYTSKEIPQQSPFPHVASPKSPSMKQSLYKELKRSNSASNFVQTPSKLAIPRTLAYPDQRLSPQQWSPQLTKPRSQNHGFRRHLSFDSSTQTWSRPSYSCKDFDDEFTKLYHKLVCLNKSSLLKGDPCRFCAKNTEASRGHTSSNLAALALSPHRPLLRKRQLDLQSYPFSKRFRDDHVNKY